MYAYLKMEMPRTCYDCKLRRRNGLELICPVLGRSYKIADTQVLFVREKDCPLIEVPEPHGRLIDADAIPYKKIMYDGDDDDFYYGVTKPYIDRMPTLIPASEEE